MISKRVQQRAEHLHIDNKIRNIRKWKLIEDFDHFRIDEISNSVRRN